MGNLDGLLSNAPEDLLKVCCGCPKIFLNRDGSSEWIDKENSRYNHLIEKYGKNITYGYCDVCYEKYSSRQK